MSTLSSPIISVSVTGAHGLSATFEMDSNASSYTLEYSQSSEFGTVSTIAGYASGDEINGLDVNVTYYVRVKAVGDGTNYTDSDWSATANAVIPPLFVFGSQIYIPIAAVSGNSPVRLAEFNIHATNRVQHLPSDSESGQVIVKTSVGFASRWPVISSDGNGGYAFSTSENQ